MLITEILILVAVALCLRLFIQWPARGWCILAASVICLFWMQPSMSVRYLDFWLPVATLMITVIAWLITLPVDTRPTRQDLYAGAVTGGLVCLIGLTRYLNTDPFITPSLPPSIINILLVLLLTVSFCLGIIWVMRKMGNRLGAILTSLIILLIVLMIILKSPVLALLSARVLRLISGQNPALATALDIRWLGISYICFRLIHTLRDRQNSRFKHYSLLTYISYVIFFPAMAAGPIDRLDRFARDFTSTQDRSLCPVTPSPAAMGLTVQSLSLARIFQQAGDLFAEDATEASRRLVLGLFKKFVLADTLALIALNPQNALQVHSPGWLWLMVYVYAFQIYFDFSGYTDIAIGLGRLLGVHLPENFTSPYLKPNLTQFWNSWHMSLTQWLRAYFFNPLVRALRARKIPAIWVLLVGQVTTMLLIGLWHGVTVNFVVWGLWHGLGQFVQSRWSEWVRPWFAGHEMTPVQNNALKMLSTFFTFNYVALGWVWFVLPVPVMSWQVLTRLFGVGG